MSTYHIHGNITGKNIKMKDKKNPKVNVMKPTKPIAQVSMEQAQKVIAEKNAKDLADCIAEVNKVETEIIQPILDKYGYGKVIQGRFVGGQIHSEIVLMKK